MIEAVASTRHMKMKLPSLKGVIITIKFDQKAAKKCYENNLKTMRGVCSITGQPQEGGGVTRAEMARERRPEPPGEVLEREIGGKKFKLGKSLSQEIQDQIIEVIARHLDTFAWSASNMLGIDLISCAIFSRWIRRLGPCYRGRGSSMKKDAWSSGKRPRSC